ncbi:AzlC family ABC transporter permease [Anoxynatronum buryatiense]|uniref:4-azaleucine resistance probable transporter AzlC n=1 Tax=Anoxynatronum buryatiense TaxID=489973 RepID=A0AA46AIX3_9CLOT|nr:AzlC family ABC transporter permease [Anoxynatronum buryatiense]SMP54255.1 4-azaleucine resistance probable transporter AzlC [Anoxynatronum buryatiense]
MNPEKQSTYKIASPEGESPGGTEPASESASEPASESSLKAKDGLAAGVPIIMGYVPVAIAFGVLSRNVGISLLHTQLFSLVVFAGASQFMAINLIALGTGMGQIILTTLLMNFRHFLMSASLSQRLGPQPKTRIPLLAFGVTDEVFSVAMTRRESLSPSFVLVLEVMAYLSWNSGTFLGYWLGDILPAMVQASLGIALYALFVAILLPEMRRSRQVLVLALGAGLLHTLLEKADLLPGGWNLVAVIVLVSWLGTYWPENRTKSDSQKKAGESRVAE